MWKGWSKYRKMSLDELETLVGGLGFGWVGMGFGSVGMGSRWVGMIKGWEKKDEEDGMRKKG